MALQELSDKLVSRLGSFGHTVKFDFEEDGVLFIDATQSPPVAKESDEDAEVTLTTTLETFEKIFLLVTAKTLSRFSAIALYITWKQVVQRNGHRKA